MSYTKFTTEILAAALEGYEAQKKRIDTRIAEIRLKLGIGRPRSTDTTEPKRKVSAAARQRMARAQKLRWKKIKQEAKQTQTETVKPKRKLSVAVRKRMAEAQKKRWAAVKRASRPVPALVKKGARNNVVASKVTSTAKKADGKTVAKKPKTAAPEQQAVVVGV